MSTSKFETARSLIKQKRYAEARSLLQTINDPKAKAWIVKLDNLIESTAPIPPPPSSALPLYQHTNQTPSVSKPIRREKRIFRDFLLAFLAFIILFAVAIGSFFLGRESLKMEIAQAFTGLFQSSSTNANTEIEYTPFVMPTFNFPTQAPPPTRQSTMNNPVPAGEPIILPRGQVRILSFQNPSQIPLQSLYTFGGEATPARGARFVAMELEFTCSEREVTCQSYSINPDLILEDGRIVNEESDLFAIDRNIRDEEIVGGMAITVWRFFEMPTNANGKVLRFTDTDLFYSSSPFIEYGELPDPVNS